MSMKGWSAVVSLNKAFIEIWLKTQFLFYLLILTVFLCTNQFQSTHIKHCCSLNIV